MKPIKPEVLPNPDQSLAKRRNFLLGAGVGAVGAVAVAVGGQAPEILAAVSADEKAKKSQSGYRMTPHIAHYYRTTQM